MRPLYLDTRVYYSLKCLVLLAQAGAPRQAKELAELTGIPPAETAKILSLLAWGGFLASKRGSKGGFWLRHAPSQTHIKDVVHFLEPQSAGGSVSRDQDSILRVWERKVGKTLEKFEKLSLADLVREGHKILRNSKDRMRGKNKTLRDPSRKVQGKQELKLDKPLREGKVMFARYKKDLSFFAILAASLFVYFLLNQTPSTEGIPAFARKYQTACSTCHSNYPELNDFGEAFKKNGFKFPTDDESFVKEAPVMLGAKAQKEAFPKAVYPGEIPGSIPIGFRYSGFASYNSKQPFSVGYLPRTDLFTPNTFTVIAAGSFGPTLSFWIDDDISTGGSGADGGLGDGYIKVNDLGHYLHLPKDSLNLRMGQFELDVPFSQARTVNLTDYDIYDETAAIGALPGTTNNAFSIGAPQRGIEIGGYPNDGNFEWSAAVVNGNNDSPAARNSKDVYFRVSQRFNLERDPSVRKEIRASGPTGPHDHTSIRFGAFYYHGDNALNINQSMFPSFGTIHEPFYRAGGDVRFKYRKLEVYALGMHGHDENQIPNLNNFTLEPGPSVNFSGGFAEAEYWFFPWVIGIMRYDVVNSPTDFQNGASAHNSRNRISPGIQFLVRDNIKAEFEYQYRWQQPIPNTTDFFRGNGFSAGFDYVF